MRPMQWMKRVAVVGQQVADLARNTRRSVAMPTCSIMPTETTRSNCPVNVAVVEFAKVDPVGDAGGLARSLARHLDLLGRHVECRPRARRSLAPDGWQATPAGADLGHRHARLELQLRGGVNRACCAAPPRACRARDRGSRRRNIAGPGRGRAGRGRSTGRSGGVRWAAACRSDWPAASAAIARQIRRSTFCDAWPARPERLTENSCRKSSTVEPSSKVSVPSM